MNTYFGIEFDVLNSPCGGVIFILCRPCRVKANSIATYCLDEALISPGPITVIFVTGKDRR